MNRPLCLLVAGLPSALALAACTPVVRQFGNTGGAGTTTGTATTTSAGMTVGGTGGGTGGSTATASCIVPQPTPFTILAPTDTPGNLSDKFVVVADPGTTNGHALVHVIVSTNDPGGGMTLRTVANSSPNGLGSIVTYTSTQFSPVAGWVTPGADLFLQGSMTMSPNGAPAEIGQLTYTLDPFQGLTNTTAPTFTGYPTPTDCQGQNYPNNLIIGPGASGGANYIVSCNMSSNAADLWVGSSDPTTTPTMVASGMKTDTLETPGLYTVMNGVNFATFTGGSMGAPMGEYSFGTDTDLATLLPLTIQQGELGVPYALAPNTVNGGFTFFAASINTDVTMGSIWGGTVLATDLTELADVPPPTLHQVVPPTSIMQFSQPSTPNADTKSLYMAGPPLLTNDAVNFTWTLLDGTPLWVNQQVYTTTNTVVTAAAAPFGLDQALVVWIEEDSASPPNFTVYGLKLVCTM
jgi:hypothetical protein